LPGDVIGFPITQEGRATEIALLVRDNRQITNGYKIELPNERKMDDGCVVVSGLLARG